VFLIDGYNLLHAVAPGRATPAARERLLDAVVAFCRRGGYSARVVFDATGGMRRVEQRGPVEIRVVAEGRKADDEILAALGATSDRTAWTLVSNDLALVKPAEKGGFKVLGCADFARLLAPADGADDKPGAAGDVDAWLKEFGIEE
jgi:hypothetical protein